MCLAVPGKILDVRAEPAAGNVGTVDFHGTRLEVSLVLTPQANPGDWVLVHAGFALNVLDEQEAMQTWEYLREMDAIELGIGEGARKDSRTSGAIDSTPAQDAGVAPGTSEAEPEAQARDRSG